MEFKYKFKCQKQSYWELEEIAEEIDEELRKLIDPDDDDIFDLDDDDIFDCIEDSKYDDLLHLSKIMFSILVRHCYYEKKINRYYFNKIDLLQKLGLYNILNKCGIIIKTYKNEDKLIVIENDNDVLFYKIGIEIQKIFKINYGDFLRLDVIHKPLPKTLLKWYENKKMKIFKKELYYACLKRKFKMLKKWAGVK